MAVWDPIESGCHRKQLSNKIFDESLGTLLSANRYSHNLKLVVPDTNDLMWWKAVSKAVRNKVNHVDIPAIFRIAKELQLEYDYAYSGFDSPNSWDEENPNSWGMFWHRFGDKLAADFIVQVTDQVFNLIKNTQWKSDESRWISQKYEYEGFFQEKWDFESLQISLKRVYDDAPNNICTPKSGFPPPK